MISKMLSLLVMGPLLAIIPAFFFFIGIKSNYFDAQEIPVFYNILFVDHISWPIFFAVALLLGMLFVLPKRMLLPTIIYALFVGASFAPFLPSIGKSLGEKLFSKENFHIKQGRFTYHGILLFESRKSYFLKDDESHNMIEFRKDKIDEAY